MHRFHHCVYHRIFCFERVAYATNLSAPHVMPSSCINCLPRLVVNIANVASIHVVCEISLGILPRRQTRNGPDGLAMSICCNP